MKYGNAKWLYIVKVTLVKKTKNICFIVIAKTKFYCISTVEPLLCLKYTIPQYRTALRHTYITTSVS